MIVENFGWRVSVAILGAYIRPGSQQNAYAGRVSPVARLNDENIGRRRCVKERPPFFSCVLRLNVQLVMRRCFRGVRSSFLVNAASITLILAYGLEHDKHSHPRTREEQPAAGTLLRNVVYTHK